MSPPFSGILVQSGVVVCVGPPSVPPDKREVRGSTPTKGTLRTDGNKILRNEINTRKHDLYAWGKREIHAKHVKFHGHSGRNLGNRPRNTKTTALNPNSKKRPQKCSP